MAKRRETLAQKMADIEAQQDKIKAVQDQLEGAVQASENEEARLRSEFEADDTALVEQIRSLGERRASW